MKQVVLYIILLFAYSCKLTTSKPLQLKSDTTRVIELAVRTAFLRQSMPEIDKLVYNKKFKDSLLFTSDSSLLNFLPYAVDSLGFKIVPKNKLIKTNNSKSYSKASPNYLYLRTVEKTDKGYYVSLQCLSFIPFGGGGAIGLNIVKEKDSFYVVSQQSSSIN